jgi:hypothetical protein
MPKKPSTKVKPKPASKRPTTKPVATPAPVTTAASSPAPKAPAPKVTRPRPASARFRRASLTPAARRGLDAVRFIRIHQKRPFGKRGEQGIVDIVREAARLAARELDAAQQPQTGGTDAR